LCPTSMTLPTRTKLVDHRHIHMYALVGAHVERKVDEPTPRLLADDARRQAGELGILLFEAQLLRQPFVFRNRFLHELVFSLEDLHARLEFSILLVDIAQGEKAVEEIADRGSESACACNDWLRGRSGNVPASDPVPPLIKKVPKNAITSSSSTAASSIHGLNRTFPHSNLPLLRGLPAVSEQLVQMIEHLACAQSHTIRRIFGYQRGYAGLP